MRFVRHAIVVAVGLLLASASGAEEPESSENSANWPAVQQPQGLMYDARPAAHEVSDGGQARTANQPYPTTPFAGHPYPNQPASFELYGSPESGCCTVCGHSACLCGQAGPGVGCCDVCGCDVCQCGDFNYRSGWFVGFDIGGMNANMVGTSDDDATFFDDAGGAARITLGYEWQDGFGIRAQSWGYSVEDVVQRTIVTVGHQVNHPVQTAVPLIYSTHPDFLEINAGTFYFDFYKAIVTRHGELLVGAGPAAGMLEFYFPNSSHSAEFRGGGASVFAQGLYPFFMRPRWQLGLIGQTRFALLSGDWEDRQGHSLNDRGDNMSIWELATGLEFRRRCGRLANHYWYVRVMGEMQQWSSDRMTPYASDTLGLDGTSVHLGFGW